MTDPESFAELYPHLTAALRAMRSNHASAAAGFEIDREAVAKELADSNRAGQSLLNVLEVLLGKTFPPDEDFIRFSLTAYDFLGVSDDVCVFMGRLWADVVSLCEVPHRAKFLMMLVKDQQTVFQALDFAAELLQRTKFNANEVFPFIVEAHRLVSKDLIQQGFWRCVHVYCSTNTEEAITVLDWWLASNPQGPSLRVATTMIAQLRLAVAGDAPLSTHFAAIEGRVRAEGNPAWRALYIESWAYRAADHAISEQGAIQMRDQYVRPGSEEEIAWSFLLYSVAQVRQGPKKWIGRELKKIARRDLTEAAKYWAVAAALHALVSSPDDDGVAAAEYRGILEMLLPIGAESIGTWEKIYETLRTLLDTGAGLARALIRLLAANSGHAWLKVVQDRRFVYFFKLLQQKDLHRLIAEDLCFQPGATARHMGLVIFSECEVPGISAEALASATDTQVELLFLEAQRRVMDFGALARLHSSLARRIDQIPGDFPTRFHEECALQCLNTYQYRAALAAAAYDHEYLPDITADASERLAETAAASNSAALKMEVPGMRRALRAHDREFAREVAKTMKEHSVFLNSLPTIILLYGGSECRTFLGERPLSEASKLKPVSSDVEIPRLEFVDPEGTHLRRVGASNRIAELEGRDAEGSGT